MQSIVNHLLKYEAFRRALIAAGWTPPVVQNIGGGKGEE